MKKTLLVASLGTLSITAAYAGGMDRSGQPITALFEKGTYLELGAYTVKPNVSGSLMGSLHSGDVSKRFTQFGGAYKQDLSNDWSMAIIVDQPYGADLRYPSGTGYPLAGTTASVDSLEVSGILRYKINTPFSVYAGARNLTSKGKVHLPSATYSMKTDTQNDWGYLVGVAYEIPEIALRASLTYNSPIKIHFHNKEAITSNSLAAETPLDVTMPKSINFDFQTGITPTTLLMFSARWVEWKKTQITPQFYTTFVSPGDNLVDYSENTISYRLGIGQKLTDTLSGSLAVAYEKSSGNIVSNLSPTDGYKALIAGLKYQATPSTAIAAGISYSWIGDAKTSLSGNETKFDNNHATGLGLKVSHHF
ncbi:Outer membrane protein transport protein (OMPP1/FadL/TodX) [Marinomonas spartinae]|uniref:OmpP1/FadL family transporter n=1 Tax=Marinomonas spartinae TaxID=1792290 RepID=UPI00080913FE|nr:outer membrane protein transport protein [Marinomonas spartinae]SBS28007.1 Outer membrane protein transport protein (OMPP1/FadL/TodX) [Marinomonas spartinae]